MRITNGMGDLIFFEEQLTAKSTHISSRLRPFALNIVWVDADRGCPNLPSFARAPRSFRDGVQLDRFADFRDELIDLERLEENRLEAFLAGANDGMIGIVAEAGHQNHRNH